MSLQFKHKFWIPLFFACSWLNPNLLYAASNDELAQNEADSTEQSDPEDSDASSESGKWGNFVPLPIFITEPAIGEGLGLALVYFHSEKDRVKPKLTTGRAIGGTANRSKPPPTATGVFGAKTNNGSAAFGIGHSNSFLDDKYRLVVAAADARIESNFYVDDSPFKFNLEGNILAANLKRRLSDSNAFIGFSTSLLDANNDFGGDLPGSGDISLGEFDFVDIGLAVNLTYDTRDNTLMPASGYLVDFALWAHDESIGGDFDYRKTKIKGLLYHQFNPDYVLGFRADISGVDGAIPFYAGPYVKLRGIPALRYQGKAAAALELEGRRRIGERWSASLFAGSGYVDEGQDFSSTDDDIYAVGLGLRYLVLPRQDVWVGVDAARGPEDTALYIQMGSTW